MRTWLTLPAAVLLTVAFAHAQSPVTGTGSVQTGSGSATTDPVRTDRAMRAGLLRTNLAAHLKREGQWQTKQEEYLQKRMDHRVNCRAEMRQANRDTKLPTLLRCFRGELTMEREQLRQERDYVAVTQGIGDALRAATMRKIDLLREAINAVTFAIDSGVYESQDALAGAKRKLHANYRARLDALRTLVRAEHALSWVALLLEDLGTDATGSGSVVPPRQDCLTAQETALRTLVTEGTGSTVRLTDVLGGFGDCVHKLQTQAGSGALSTP